MKLTAMVLIAVIGGTSALAGALTFPSAAPAAETGAETGAAAAAAAATAEFRAERRRALFAALARSETELEARKIERAIWAHWFEAPTPEAQSLLDRAMVRRRMSDLAGAITILDELVETAPDYSEGWNQRATVLFLQGKYDRSLSDIERTLELEPKHFGALAGQVVIMLRQGRPLLARSILRRALEIDPWLRERALLPSVKEQKI